MQRKPWHTRGATSDVRESVGSDLNGLNPDHPGVQEFIRHCLSRRQVLALGAGSFLAAVSANQGSQANQGNPAKVDIQPTSADYFIPNCFKGKMLLITGPDLQPGGGSVCRCDLWLQQRQRPPGVHLSAGWQGYRISNGMLFANGSSNGNNRGAILLNPRTAFEGTGIARFRWNNLLLEEFYLNPDELPLLNTNTTYAGVNLEYNDNRSLQFGLSYITVPESNFSYFTANDVFSRQALNVIYPRVLWRNPLGLDGLWLQAEYAHQWNDDFNMAANDRWAQAGCTAQRMTWTPSLSYRYALFSGDNPDWMFPSCSSISTPTSSTTSAAPRRCRSCSRRTSARSSASRPATTSAAMCCSTARVPWPSPAPPSSR